MNYTTLIEPAELRVAVDANGAAPGWTVIDCRFELMNPGAGRAAYRAGHIPGAHYAHMNEDLSAPVTAATGRHPLPQISELAQHFGRWGITTTTQVVAYDDANGAFAARLWWLARWLGHRKVAVLNGGFKAWVKAGFPVDTHEVPAQNAQFAPSLQPGLWIDTPTVERAVAGGQMRLIDARSSDRFAGQNETIDPVAGHIPGAINHPFARNVDADQRFLSAKQLRNVWQTTLQNAPPQDFACMCGSGVTACHNLLALEHAGLSGAKLYAGSWSEWIRDPRRPIARD